MDASRRTTERLTSAPDTMAKLTSQADAAVAEAQGFPIADCSRMLAA